MNGYTMTKTDVLKDPGVRFSASMNIAEQVTHVAESGSMICNRILRCLCPKNEDAYLKVYESHSVPILLCASQVWRPTWVCDLEILEKMHIST